MTYYRNILKPIEINNINIYNTYSKQRISTNVESFFRTTKDERKLKLSNLYKFISIAFSQRPFLEKVMTYNIKKKIVKEFKFSLNISKINNFYSYLLFYTHFYHIFFTKRLKYDKHNSSYKFIIDNLQLFFSNNDIKQKIRIYLNTSYNRLNHDFITRNLNLRRWGI